MIKAHRTLSETYRISPRLIFPTWWKTCNFQSDGRRRETACALSEPREREKKERCLLWSGLNMDAFDSREPVFCITSNKRARSIRPWSAFKNFQDVAAFQLLLLLLPQLIHLERRFLFSIGSPGSPSISKVLDSGVCSELAWLGAARIAIDIRLPFDRRKVWWGPAIARRPWPRRRIRSRGRKHAKRRGRRKSTESGPICWACRVASASGWRCPSRPASRSTPGTWASAFDACCAPSRSVPKWSEHRRYRRCPTCKTRSAAPVITKDANINKN